MKKIGVFIGCIIVAGGGVFWWLKAPKTPAAPTGQVTGRVPANKTGSVEAPPSRTNLIGQVLNLDAYTNLPEREKPFVQKMQDALDEDDLEGVVAAAGVLMKSESADARRDTVWALGWFGAKALPQLAQMLGDAEEDIAKTAAFHFENGVREVTDDDLKAGLLEAAFLTVKDSDDLASLAMLFNDLPDSLAVRTLVKIIESGNVLAGAAARDQYEFITGNEYTSKNDAENWIQQNPDPGDGDGDIDAPDVPDHDTLLKQLGV